MTREEKEYHKTTGRSESLETEDTWGEYPALILDILEEQKDNLVDPLNDEAFKITMSKEFIFRGLVNGITGSNFTEGRFIFP
ncbi:MAG: hypothetical protein FWG63_00230, partial [Defluviitaleaceae bacterium]|nr:hypothetical protein [Defluviitaleaceae bacterium]